MTIVLICFSLNGCVSKGSINSNSPGLSAGLFLKSAQIE